MKESRVTGSLLILLGAVALFEARRLAGLREEMIAGAVVGDDTFPLIVGAPQPAVRGVVDGLSYRVDRLKALGNAVVPAQGAVAVRTLLATLPESVKEGMKETE